MVEAILVPRDLVLAFERKYRRDHQQEHAMLLDKVGRVVVQRDGDVDSVQFETTELDQAQGGLLLHNHPRNLSFSGPDLKLASEYSLTLRAIGVSPDTGDQFDHTIALVPPTLADTILSDFDNAVERAEQELAPQPYRDLAWQRESRHLAVSRLAREHSFLYHRVQHGVALSESKRRDQRRLDMLGTVEARLRGDVFAPLRDSLVRMLTRHSAHGQVTAGAIGYIRAEMNALVQRTILGKPDMNGALTPYRIVRGEVSPNSVYFAALWSLMQQAAGVAIDYHARLMRQHLPADLVRAYEMATLNPFDTALSEAAGDGFNPLHLWTGSDGRQLSDRVWNAAGDLRRKLDAYLSDAIASGKGVPQIAAELEDYLLPGAKHGRIKTPFGNLSWEALRLARTEVAFAYARADSLAAQGNPLVETYNFRTAPQHQCCDVCDLVEQGGPYPKSDMAHLPPQHVSCVCGIVWNMVSAVEQVVAHLKTHYDRAVTNATRSVMDLIGPLSKRFLALLFRGRS